MLKVEDLEVRYGGIRALNDISIDVKDSETVLLVGSNGGREVTNNFTNLPSVLFDFHLNMIKKST
jgi:ABC-type branched-subunit amino acid transport system ATPase component